MLLLGRQVQGTIAFEQAYYIPILTETFITARKAEGLSKGTLKYYREKLTIFLAWCEGQAVTQLQDLTPGHTSPVGNMAVDLIGSQLPK